MTKNLLIIILLSTLSGCWFHAGPVGGGVGKAYDVPDHTG